MKRLAFDLKTANDFADRREENLFLLEVTNNGGIFAIVKIEGYFKNGKIVYMHDVNGFDKVADIESQGNITCLKAYRNEGYLMRRIDKMGVNRRAECFIGIPDKEKYLYVKETLFEQLEEDEFFIFQSRLWHLIAPSEAMPENTMSSGYAFTDAIADNEAKDFEPTEKVWKIIDWTVRWIKEFSNEEQQVFGQLSRIVGILHTHKHLLEFYDLEKMICYYEPFTLINKDVIYVPVLQTNEARLKSSLSFNPNKDAIDKKNGIAYQRTKPAYVFINGNVLIPRSLAKMLHLPHRRSSYKIKMQMQLHDRSVISLFMR